MFENKIHKRRERLENNADHKHADISGYQTMAFPSETHRVVHKK